MSVRKQVAAWLMVCWMIGAVAESDMARLRTKLLTGYDKNSRPVLKDNETVVVKMAFYVHHLLELDEKTETLFAEGVLKMEWDDRHLVWNPSQYGNLTFIRLGDREIWQPDVYLFHSSGQNKVDDDKSTFSQITNDGHVVWIPPASLKVPCVASYTNYPFEKHWCEFEFGSWTHHGDNLLLLTYDDFKIDPSKVTGGEWRITEWSYNVREYYVYKTHPYNTVNLTLAVQRTSSIHKITSVVPIVSSCALSLAGFWLDVWSNSRYILGLGNFAIVALQLLDIGTTLPGGRDIPLLAQFSGTAVCMAALFLILTVVLDSTQRLCAGPPEGLIRFCKSLPEKTLCLPAEDTDRPEQRSAAADDSSEKNLRDWHLVCRVLDRIIFWIFSVVYVVVTSLLLSVV